MNTSATASEYIVQVPGQLNGRSNRLAASWTGVKQRLFGEFTYAAGTWKRTRRVKNGRPVAQLGPVVTRPPTLAGAHRGKIRILGDILAPIDVDWEATR